MFLKLEPRPSSAEKANMRETRPGLSERPGVNKRHSEQEIADYFWRLWKCRSGHLCFALWWFFNNSTFSDTFYIHAKWLVWIHKSWSDWGESYFLSLTDDTQGPFGKWILSFNLMTSTIMMKKWWQMRQVGEALWCRGDEPTVSSERPISAIQHQGKTKFNCTCQPCCSIAQNVVIHTVQLNSKATIHNSTSTLHQN